MVLIWFGLVLWHINHCRLFNAKSFLYTYIKYMISKQILEITFLNEADLFIDLFFFILFPVKWFHLSLSNTNNYIYNKCFVCT